MIFAIVRAKRGRLRRPQFVGQIHAANGRELFRTSETYANAGDVLQAFDALGDDEAVSSALDRLARAIANGDHLA